MIKHSSERWQGKGVLEQMQELRDRIKELEKENKSLDQDNDMLIREISKWRQGSNKALINIHKKAKSNMLEKFHEKYPQYDGNFHGFVWDCVEYKSGLNQEEWTKGNKKDMEFNF